MLGTRGVPARHGGFETAAENIGLELVQRGWRVVIYCQDDEPDTEVRTDVWQGIERIFFPSKYAGAKGTIWFDQQVTRHAARHGDLCLVFGYNTGFMHALLRLRGVPHVVNMDGIEWRRAKWSRNQRIYLRANERLAATFGNHLIADHPEIRRHLLGFVRPDKVTTIAYGAPLVDDAPKELIEPYGLRPQGYLAMIARPEPENSVLEVVEAFSRKRRPVDLAVLGRYRADNAYHREVRAAAGPQVRFLGPIYKQCVVKALRFHSAGYMHGHTVGGTNPSLVEALGAGTPVIAHDNPFNRWVAQDAGVYFGDGDQLDLALDSLGDTDRAHAMSEVARQRHAAAFTWSHITDLYESLLRDHLPVDGR